MREIKIFGTYDPNIIYQDRRAAYAIIFNQDRDQVAAVRWQERYWLPGGGVEHNETNEEAVIRELHEELGSSVKLIEKLGPVVQYFYGLTDDCYYKMEAVFYRAEFIEQAIHACEHELHWVLISAAYSSFFHECQAWAIHHFARV